jgi:hypothetical protein
MAYGCKKSRTTRCLKVSTCGWLSAGVDGPMVIVSGSGVTCVTSSGGNVGFLKAVSGKGSGAGSFGGATLGTLFAVLGVEPIGCFDILAT